MKWYPKEITKFRTLWAAGLSFKEIGKRLGRSPTSVDKARCRFNLPSRGPGAYRRPPRVVSEHSIQGAPIGHLYSNMKRETPEQSAKWAKLLGAAR